MLSCSRSDIIVQNNNSSHDVIQKVTTSPSVTISRNLQTNYYTNIANSTSVRLIISAVCNIANSNFTYQWFAVTNSSLTPIALNNNSNVLTINYDNNLGTVSKYYCIVTAKFNSVMYNNELYSSTSATSNTASVCFYNASLSANSNGTNWSYNNAISNYETILAKNDLKNILNNLVYNYLYNDLNTTIDLKINNNTYVASFTYSVQNIDLQWSSGISDTNSSCNLQYTINQIWKISEVVNNKIINTYNNVLTVTKTVSYSNLVLTPTLITQNGNNYAGWGVNNFSLASVAYSNLNTNNNSNFLNNLTTSLLTSLNINANQSISSFNLSNINSNYWKMVDTYSYNGTYGLNYGSNIIEPVTFSVINQSYDALVSNTTTLNLTASFTFTSPLITNHLINANNVNITYAWFASSLPLNKINPNDLVQTPLSINSNYTIPNNYFNETGVTYFICKITSSYDNEIYSNYQQFTLNVYNFLVENNTYSYTNDLINTQTIAANNLQTQINKNNLVDFAVKVVTNNTINTNFDYQWYYAVKTVTGISNYKKLNGATNNSLSMQTVNNLLYTSTGFLPNTTYYFYCVVSLNFNDNNVVNTNSLVFTLNTLNSINLSVQNVLASNASYTLIGKSGLTDINSTDIVTLKSGDLRAINTSNDETSTLNNITWNISWYVISNDKDILLTTGAVLNLNANSSNNYLNMSANETYYYTVSFNYLYNNTTYTSSLITSNDFIINYKTPDLDDLSGLTNVSTTSIVYNDYSMNLTPMNYSYLIVDNSNTSYSCDFSYTTNVELQSYSALDMQTNLGILYKSLVIPNTTIANSNNVISVSTQTSNWITTLTQSQIFALDLDTAWGMGFAISTSIYANLSNSYININNELITILSLVTSWVEISGNSLGN